MYDRILEFSPKFTPLGKYDKKEYHQIKNSAGTNHLIYIDTLKVYTNNKTDLIFLLNRVKKIDS